MRYRQDGDYFETALSRHIFVRDTDVTVLHAIAPDEFCVKALMYNDCSRILGYRLYVHEKQFAQKHKLDANSAIEHSLERVFGFEETRWSVESHTAGSFSGKPCSGPLVIDANKALTLSKCKDASHMLSLQPFEKVAMHCVAALESRIAYKRVLALGKFPRYVPIGKTGVFFCQQLRRLVDHKETHRSEVDRIDIPKESNTLLLRHPEHGGEKNVLLSLCAFRKRCPKTPLEHRQYKIPVSTSLIITHVLDGWEEAARRLNVSVIILKSAPCFDTLLSAQKIAQVDALIITYDMLESIRKFDYALLMRGRDALMGLQIEDEKVYMDEPQNKEDRGFH